MDLDELVEKDLVQFREKIIDNLQEKHPYLIKFLNSMLSGKQNKVGMQVTENQSLIGEYTFHLNGIRIASVEAGTMTSEVHHPFLGVIKPYAVVERKYLEDIVQDTRFLEDIFGTLPQYLPGITIKFLP